MYIDILQNIMNYLYLVDQIKISQLDKQIYDNIKIYYLDDNRINDKILQQKKFNMLKKLVIQNNRNVTNLNHLLYLEDLTCSGLESSISDESIKQLYNLKKLHATDNKQIKDINHLINLTELTCGYGCGIDDVGIKNLINLKKILAYENVKIKEVNHFKKLEILSACGASCGISNISNLSNLKELYVNHNPKIIIYNLPNLEILECEYSSGLSDPDIVQLDKLKKLNAYGNSKIKNVNHLKNLEELDCGWRCEISNVESLYKLKKISAIHNPKITAKYIRSLPQYKNNKNLIIV